VAARDEILARLDRHLARSSELMTQVREEMRLTRDQHTENMRQMREMTRGYRAATSRLIDVVDENLRAMREMTDESRAQRKAILAVIDYLRGNGPRPELT
jgi:hypothetical protein